MAADPFLGLVRAHDHCGSVPADQALDSALQVGAARHQRLIVGRDRVDVRGIGGERNLDAVFRRVERQLAQQALNFDRTAALEHIIKGIEPFAGFDGIEIRRVFGSYISHGSSFLFPVLANRDPGRRTSRQTEAQAVGQSLIVTALAGEGEHAETQPTIARRFRLRLAPARDSLVTRANRVAATGERVSPRASIRPAQPIVSIACTDFYQFACGGWLAANPIPADRPRWGRFDELQERNDEVLRRVLEAAAAGRDAAAKKIGDYYATCMDEARSSEAASSRSSPI